MSDLTAVSLFAGIEGIGLAFERSGVDVVASVEIDPDCRGVIARHFPKTTLFDDVRTVTGDHLRAAGFVPGRGVLGAGWPCQGNSVAGRGKGMADPRSGLWRHIVRLLAETRPRWFLGENVPGLLSVNDGRDFGRVLADLDELGYGVAWAVLDARFFGVPQRRRRVFIVGCLGDGGTPVEVLLDPEGSRGNPPAGGETRKRDPRGTEGSAGGPGGIVSTLQGGGRRGSRIDAESAAGGQLVVMPVALRGRDDGSNIECGRPGDPAFTLRTPGGGSSHPIIAAFSENQRGEVLETPYSRQLATGGGKPGQGYGAVRQGTAVRRLTPLERERLQGFPDDWTRWKLKDGKLLEQPDSARDRQTGNAVAVPCVEWITRRIVAVDASLVAAEDAA